MTLHSEVFLAKAHGDLHIVVEFLQRFLSAADSHVELEPFIVEGEELLRSIEE